MDKEGIYLNRIKNIKEMTRNLQNDLKILFSVMVQTGAKASHQQKINKFLNQPLDYPNQIKINRYGLILESKTEIIEYIHSSKIDMSLLLRKKKQNF
jgi:hypothetical protein